MDEQIDQKAEKNKISRRGFLKAGSAAVGTVVLGGVAACGDNVTRITQTSGTSTEDDSWLTTPPTISTISKTVTCDVIVVGSGNSGIAATRAAVEAGAKVVCIEKSATYDTHGFQIAAVNSQRQKDAGATTDPQEILQAYERMTIGRANMAVMGLWAAHSGEFVDWFTAPVANDSATTQNINLVYWPLQPQHDPSGDLYKHFVGTIDFTEGSSAMSNTYKANYDICVKLGVDYYYKTAAQKLVTSGGRVTGVIAKNDQGEYIQFNAGKGVVLCTGTFGGSKRLVEKYCPQSVAIAKRLGFTGNFGTEFTPAGAKTTGDGHLMGIWAGAQMEQYSDVQVASAETIVEGTSVLTVNRLGARVGNEDIEIWQKRDVALNNGGFLWDIFDVNWQNAIPYMTLSHRCWDLNRDNDKKILASIQQGLLALVGNAKGGSVSLGATSHFSYTCYAANTIAELATMIGVPSATLQATVDRYNQMCTAKKDTDFAKDPQKLFAVNTAPFFASKSVGTGFGLGPGSGLATNEQLQPLDVNGNPIPGLWVAGNVLGGRFAPYYQTPLSGLTNGTAFTHGMLAGRFAAKG